MVGFVRIRLYLVYIPGITYRDTIEQIGTVVISHKSVNYLMLLVHKLKKKKPQVVKSYKLRGSKYTYQRIFYKSELVFESGFSPSLDAVSLRYY